MICLARAGEIGPEGVTFIKAFKTACRKGCPGRHPARPTPDRRPQSRTCWNPSLGCDEADGPQDRIRVPTLRHRRRARSTCRRRATRRYGRSL